MEEQQEAKEEEAVAEPVEAEGKVEEKEDHEPASELIEEKMQEEHIPAIMGCRSVYAYKHLNSIDQGAYGVVRAPFSLERRRREHEVAASCRCIGPKTAKQERWWL